MLPNPAMLWLININRHAASGHGDENEPSSRHHEVSITESQHHVINPTNLCGALDYRIRTRCTSVGERLMMPSTSAVAV